MTTSITVNVTRHETLSYDFDGELTQDAALELVQSGEHEPTWSKIHHEDIDVVEFDVGNHEPRKAVG